MKYRRLGDAGIKVSVVALGGWINFGKGRVASDNARQIIGAAYDKGINFFDLADFYTKGEAEKEFGAILKDFPRHTLVISSKVCAAMSDDVNDRGLSRKHIMESIDKSLRRLGTDYLDIYFCHHPDPETPVREIAQAMNSIIEQGKALYWGTCSWSAAQIVEAYDLCDRFGWHLPKTEQTQYSMLHRAAAEKEILPIASSRGIGLIAFSPLALGMLTGKYDEEIPENSRFHRESWIKGRFYNEENAAKVRLLKSVADELGLTRAQLALAWALRHPGVSSVITGATGVEQVEENSKAADVEISNETAARIDAILA